MDTVYLLNFDISSSTGIRTLEILPPFTPNDRHTFKGKKGKGKIHPGTGHEGPEGE